MTITNEVEALAYFELLVEHAMSFGKTRAFAETVERFNLGYWAGYYDYETRLRVEALFHCEHPYFGAATGRLPSPHEAFAQGIAEGQRMAVEAAKEGV